MIPKIREGCDKKSVVDPGQEGPAADVFSTPKEEYTKALLAAAFNMSVLHKSALAS